MSLVTRTWTRRSRQNSCARAMEKRKRGDEWNEDDEEETVGTSACKRRRKLYRGGMERREDKTGDDAVKKTKSNVHAATE